MEKIIAIVSEFTDVPAEQIKPDSQIVSDLGLTSLDIMDMVNAFEDEYDLEISDQEIKSMKSIADIQNYIESHA